MLKILGLLLSAAILPGQPPKTDINILTINMWGLPGVHKGGSIRRTRFRYMCAKIKSLQPDILLLQEVWLRTDYRYVVRSCGYRYHTKFIYPFVGKYTGLVILSKFPIEKEIRIDFPNSVYKGAVLAYVKVGNKRLYVFNTHLTANLNAKVGTRKNIFGQRMFLKDRKEHKRRKQLFHLTKWISAYTKVGPVILGGDLNTGPRYPLWWNYLTVLATRKVNLIRNMSYTKNLGCTYCNMYTSLSEGQIDHVIGFGGAKIKSSKIVLKEKYRMWNFLSRKYVYSTISDHYGIFSSVRF